VGEEASWFFGRPGKREGKISGEGGVNQAQAMHEFYGAAREPTGGIDQLHWRNSSGNGGLKGVDGSLKREGKHDRIDSHRPGEPSESFGGKAKRSEGKYQGGQLRRYEKKKSGKGLTPVVQKTIPAGNGRRPND